MKKLQFLLVTLLTFTLSLDIVRAECSASEKSRINSLAFKVSASYEAVEVESYVPGMMPPDGMTIEERENFKYYKTIFRIYISNMTEELSLKVTDSVSKETKTYNFDDAVNGVITIEQTDLTKINRYTIEVYSSNKTDCPDTKLYTTYLNLPRYNEHSTLGACQGNEKFYMCQEYTMVPEISMNDFFSSLGEYRLNKIDKDGNPIKEEEKKPGFFERNKTTIIVSSIIIVAVGGLVTVMVVRKQRSRIV